MRAAPRARGRKQSKSGAPPHLERRHRRRSARARVALAVLLQRRELLLLSIGEPLQLRALGVRARRVERLGLAAKRRDLAREARLVLLDEAGLLTSVFFCRREQRNSGRAGGQDGGVWL